MSDRSPNTRRFEMGMPHLADLDLGAIFSAQARLEKGEMEGLTGLLRAFSGMGETRVVRRLAAIWGATDLELKQAEVQPQVLAELEERQALRPYGDSLKDAMGFFSGLMTSLGASLVSSPLTGTTTTTPQESPENTAASPSGDC
jgi:hypothetical protein